jgi:hypothetical protein
MSNGYYSLFKYRTFYSLVGYGTSEIFIKGSTVEEVNMPRVKFEAHLLLTHHLAKKLQSSNRVDYSKLLEASSKTGFNRYGVCESIGKAML